MYPEHKHAIVDALQRRGLLIGMTGDGLNDTPALKKANVGIAVAGATAAAKGAADIILTQAGGAAAGVCVLALAVRLRARAAPGLTSGRRPLRSALVSL